MRADRPRNYRAAGLFFVTLAIGCGMGCATGQSEGVSATTQDMRSGGAGDSGGGHFVDWKRLTKTLAGLGGGACSAIIQDREDNASALIIPARCLFADGTSDLATAGRPAVNAIVRELLEVTDREFWIAAPAASNDNAAGEARARARAAALVNALVAAGVAPGRLAAIVGVGGPEQNRRRLPAPLANSATVEIVAAHTPLLPLPSAR